MKTITIHSHVGPDGSLRLELPSELRESDVVVTVTPKAHHDEQPHNDWPAGLFEKTVGQWKGEPLSREFEGEWEARNPLH